MRGYGQDCDLPLLRTIVPEDPISGRSSVFDVCFEDLLIVRAAKRTIFVCVQTGMAQIGLHQPQCLQYLLVLPSIGCRQQVDGRLSF